MKDIADYLEKAQVDTILAAAKACTLMDCLIIRMLWRSGVQVGELLNSKPEDTEFHNQIVNIVEAKRGKQRRVMLEWRLWSCSPSIFSIGKSPRMRPSLVSNATGCIALCDAMERSSAWTSTRTRYGIALPFRQSAVGLIYDGCSCYWVIATSTHASLFAV